MASRVTPAVLGHLYVELAELLASSVDHGLVKRDVSRLSDRYGSANVVWMLHVIADDQSRARLAARREKAKTR